MSNGVSSAITINPLMQTIYDHFKSVLQNQESREGANPSRAETGVLTSFVQQRILQQNIHHIQNIHAAVKTLTQSPNGISSLLKELETLDSTFSSLPSVEAVQKLSMIEATVKALSIFQKEIFNQLEHSGKFMQRFQEIRTRHRIETKSPDFLSTIGEPLSTLFEKCPTGSFEKLVNWEHYTELDEEIIMKTLAEQADGAAMVWYDRKENNLVLLLVEKKREKVHVDSIDLNSSMFDPMSPSGMSAAFFTFLQEEKGTLTTTTAASSTSMKEQGVSTTPSTRRVRFAENALRRTISDDNRPQDVVEKTKK